jgi:hypothetical protein
MLSHYRERFQQTRPIFHLMSDIRIASSFLIVEAKDKQARL